MRRLKFGRVLSLGSVALVAFALAACSNNDSGTSPQLINTAATVRSLSLSADFSDSGDLDIFADVDLTDGSPAVGVPVQFRSTSGEFVSGAQAITDATGRAKVVLRADDEATVTARANGVEADPLVATAGATKLTFKFRGDPKKADSRELETVLVTAMSTDGTATSGNLEVDFGDGRTKIFKNFKKRLEVSHNWRSSGNYRMKFKLRDSTGAQLAAGRFRVKVGPAVRMVFDVTGDDRLKPGETASFNFVATRSDGEVVRGTLNINYGDGTTDQVTDFKNRVTRTHVYDTEHDYVMIATLITSNGQKGERDFDVSVKEGPDNGDQIDLNNVFFLHFDVSGWEVAGRVTSVRISNSDICIFHTKLGGWPVFDGAEGNPWVVGNVGGSWYAGTYEWNRPGQACKGVRRTNIGQHVKQVPMITWVPGFGELVYFFASTHARFGPQSPDRQRTNAVAVNWNNGTFTFE